MAEAMIRKGSFSYQRTSTNFLKNPMSSTEPAESNTADATNAVKVVGFDLPGKRQKPSAQLTAHTVANEIHKSINKKDRINAIFTACATFNHGIEAVHDEEIQAGADIALVKHLTVLLLQRDRMRTSLDKQQKVKENQRATDTEYYGGSRNPPSSPEPKSSLSVDLSPYTQADVIGIETEINDTVSAIEMILRCSADLVSISFARAGSELLLLLLDIIQEETRKLQEREKFPCSSPVETSITAEKNSTSTLISLTNDDKPTKSHHDSSSTMSTLVPETVDKSQRKEEVTESRLKTCTKIIGHFARVGSLTEDMAHTPSFLQTLQGIISLPTQHKAPIEATLNSLWILANLACSAENMVLMTRTPNLIPVLVEIASHPTKEEEGSMESITLYMELIRSRSIAVRAILNLSWAHENKVPFASNPELLDALLETVSHRTSPWAGSGKGVSGVLLQSRRHAAGALRNLGAAPRRYKRNLCRLRSGTFLDILAEIARNDPDSSVRDKIHATLYNLVSADTAKLFTEKEFVIDVISEAAMKDDYTSFEDGSDSHTMASRTLRTLERSIPEDEEGYKVLRPHLMKRFDSIANSMTSIVQCTSSEAV